MGWDKKKFSQFEKEENLFERTYNDVPYWQMLRFIVCEGAYSNRIEQSDTLAEEKKKEKLKAYFFGLPKALISALIKHFRLKACDVICFRHKSAPDSPAEFFDYWKMPPEISTLHIDNIVNAEMLKCTDIYSLVLPAFAAKFQYSLKKLFHLLKEDQKENAFLKELEEKVKDRFGRSLSAERMKREIVAWTNYNKVYEKYYKKLFTRTGCKAIVVVCYYQTLLYAAYQVAKKQGIRIVEFQHGVINNHEEYWFEDQRGLNNNTPDYFLAFGDAHVSWTKMLPTTKAITVGFPYQEAQIEKLKDLKTEEKTIMIYPQSQNEFEAVLSDFANMAKKKGYRIMLKLHPLQAVDPKRYYPVLSENPNIEVICEQDKGIYHWLKLAKHHIMASTTVGLEAVALDHTNICIATFVPHEQTQPLLDWNVARGFNTTNELMELIENPVGVDMDEARKALWKPDGKKNIQDFFMKLQQQNWPDSTNFIE